MLIRHSCRVVAPVCPTLLFVSVGRGQFFVYNQNGFAGDAAVGEYNLDGTPVNANLITGLYFSTGIAVSGTNLFVGDALTAGTIGEYTTSGKPINTSLITGLSEPPAGIVVSGPYLFFANAENGTVSEYTTSGAVVSASLITGLNGPVALALSGSDLFVLNIGNGTVGKYTLGATPGTITSSNASLVTGFTPDDTYGLAVAGSYLFVGDSGTGRVGEYTTSGTTINASLITGLTDGLSSIAVSGSYLYTTSDGSGAGAGEVGEYTLGTTPGTLTSSNASLITGLYEPYTFAAVSAPPIINLQKAVYLTSTDLIIGFNYQVQASPDMINWTNQGSVFTATNSNWQSTNYWNVNDWSQLFFRLEVAP